MIQEIYNKNGIMGVVKYIEKETKENNAMSELAYRLGISRQALYNLFNSPNPPKFNHVEKMLDYYGWELLVENKS